MPADAGGPWKPMQANINVCVEDCENATYKRAIKAGGKSLREPGDAVSYGDRSAGVEDPWGNMWWISTDVEDVTPEEIERRAKAQGGGEKK